MNYLKTLVGVLFVAIAVILFLFFRQTSENKRLRREVEATYDQKLKTIQIRIDSIHKAYVDIDEKSKKTQKSLDSAKSIVLNLQDKLVKSKISTKKKVDEYKKLPADSAFRVYMEYLNK